MHKLRKCSTCNAYTLEEQHCGKETIAAHPPKYSPKDPYGKYRLKAREKQWTNLK
ncbi:RNA-protein complex protein Nop10 [archaeon]|nr:RNA-protein complex protein Nop10 [archaeon]